MRRPHAGEALGLGFHHRSEIIAAIGALLLHVEADRSEVFVVEGLGQECAVGLGAQRPLDGVLGEQRVFAQRTQAGATGPCECGGVVCHPGAHRVEVDVPYAAQQVIGVIDQAGLVAAFPQGASAAVPGVEQSHVVPAQLLHHPPECAEFRRRRQQVHVVVHQHVGVQAAAGGVQCFAQQLAIARAVFVVQEAGQAIVAALHDVLRDAGQVEAWEAGHARRIALRVGPD